MKMQYLPGEDVIADSFLILFSGVTYQVYMNKENSEVSVWDTDKDCESVIFRCDRQQKTPISFAIKIPQSHHYAFEALAILLNCFRTKEMHGLGTYEPEELESLLLELHSEYVKSRLKT